MAHAPMAGPAVSQEAFIQPTSGPFTECDGFYSAVLTGRRIQVAIPLMNNTHAAPRRHRIIVVAGDRIRRPDAAARECSTSRRVTLANSRYQRHHEELQTCSAQAAPLRMPAEIHRHEQGRQLRSLFSTPPAKKLQCHRTDAPFGLATISRNARHMIGDAPRRRPSMPLDQQTAPLLLAELAQAFPLWKGAVRGGSTLFLSLASSSPSSSTRSPDESPASASATSVFDNRNGTPKALLK